MDSQRISAAVTGLLLLGLPLFQPQLQPQAGWGDLLKKLEDNAPALLQSTPVQESNSLDTDTLVRGLKQALEVGTQRAVANVSKPDGYFSNPSIRVPLPTVVDRGSALLRKFGMGSVVDEFELSMNRAAEKAAPRATEYFLQTLKAMSIEEARTIYQGPDDAATRYFQQRTASQLEGEFKPVIKEAMEQVGVTRYYQALVHQAAQYPMVGDMALDLEQHVTDRALDGLFLMLAEEERLIRQDPVARSTELLKQVFGQE